MKVLIASILFLVLISSPVIESANAASVRYISPEKATEIDGKDSIEIVIRCAEIEEPTTIQKAGKPRLWNARDLPAMCSKRMITVAKKVCGNFYESAVKK